MRYGAGRAGFVLSLLHGMTGLVAASVGVAVEWSVDPIKITLLTLVTAICSLLLIEPVLLCRASQVWDRLESRPFT